MLFESSSSTVTPSLVIHYPPPPQEPFGRFYIILSPDVVLTFVLEEADG